MEGEARSVGDDDFLRKGGTGTKPPEQQGCGEENTNRFHEMFPFRSAWRKAYTCEKLYGKPKTIQRAWLP